VSAATGYKTDFGRLAFLDPKLLRDLRKMDEAPVLSSRFETSVRGLYAIGPASAASFGPLMRFVVGAEYASPFLAKHLKRRLKGRSRAQSPAHRALHPA
jgi:hypothetical protein